MLLCVTASHHTASFELLDTLSTLGPAVAAALVEQNDYIQGAVVVATCNRFEAYLDVEEPLTAASAVATKTTIDEVALLSGADAAQVRDAVEVYTGTDVAEHLFQVSSGLKSVVIGEDEIAGQVRRSLDTARRERTTSSALERLFQRASQTSRDVKTETGIGAQGRSLVRLALDLAQSRVTDWAHTRVLLVGTGKYARVSLAALRDRGVTDVRVFSPSGRAEVFAVNQGLRTVESGELTSALAECDVVVTCSASAEPVIRAEELAAAIALPGAARRRIVIDLGLPRNVEAAVAGVEGAELLDLETIARHAPLEEFSATAEAHALVGEAVAEYAAADAAAAVAPAVVALRKHLFDVLDREIERSAGKESAPQVEAALRHFVGVLLHTPSVRARELAASGDASAFVDAVRALYGVEVPAPSAAPVRLDPPRAAGA